MWVERARRAASPTWKAKDTAEQAAIKAREAENRKALEAEKQLQKEIDDVFNLPL
jgi:hypothetical protein